MEKMKATFSTMKGCWLLEGLLLLASAGFAFSGGHSHYFFTTLTYNLSSDFPSYYTTRAIDDITVFRQKLQRYHTAMQQTLYGIVQRLNHTGGFHILQIMEGCTLQDNGTVCASLSHRYDGKPFMSFIKETARWRAKTPEAEESAEMFNLNKPVLEQMQQTMRNICVSHITELLSLGNCTLNRKAPAEASMAKPNDEMLCGLCERLHNRPHCS